MTTMMAAMWYGPGDLRLEETQVPQVGPGEVLVKIHTALTCGTDFKLFRRGHAMLVKSVPSPLGHEMAGTIVALGQGVKNFKEGEMVVAANSAPCDECFFCKKNQQNLCENLEFLNGAYAEYLKIPARIVSKNLYRIPKGVPPRNAALSEPLACVLRCLDFAHLKAGESVCIIGAGPQGQLLIQAAKAQGAEVIVVGRNLEKLKVAREAGADHVLSTQEHPNITESLREIANNGYGPDIVIEAAGQPETWEMALSLTRKGGRVIFYGGCKAGTHAALGTHKIHYEEIQMSGVFHHTPKHFQQALNLISEEKINVRPIIVGERKLSEITQIFRADIPDNPLKLAVIP